MFMAYSDRKRSCYDGALDFMNEYSLVMQVQYFREDESQISL